MILLDMALPMMDGFAVVRYLKDNKDFSQIPVIAMTARVMKGEREKILAAGCDDYISKPIDPVDCLKKRLLILTDYVVRRNPRMDAATRMFWSLLKN